MIDIKLFRISSKGVQEIMGRSASVEKSLQSQIEDNFEEFLGHHTQLLTGQSRWPGFVLNKKYSVHKNISFSPDL